MRPFLWLTTFALTACGIGSDPTSDLCELEATLDMSEGTVGDTITATSHTLTTRADTVVRVGGADADVLTVDRSDGCVVFDACIEGSDCTGCETSCSATCDELRIDCVQTVSFEVPSVEPGNQPVVIQNRYGASAGIPFVALGGDTADTGYNGARRRNRPSGFRSPFTPARK